MNSQKKKGLMARIVRRQTQRYYLHCSLPQVNSYVIQGSRRFGGQILMPVLPDRNWIGYPAVEDFGLKIIATPGKFAFNLGNPAFFRTDHK
jgi:hypothetical protein